MLYKVLCTYLLIILEVELSNIWLVGRYGRKLHYWYTSFPFSLSLFHKQTYIHYSYKMSNHAVFRVDEGAEPNVAGHGGRDLHYRLNKEIKIFENLQ